jgi:protoheme ferro-lyase
MLSKDVTKCFLKKSQKAAKSFLKKSQNAVTVTHICRLFTDKKLYKSLTNSVTKYSSQNCDDRLKFAFSGHCDQMRYLGNSQTPFITFCSQISRILRTLKEN